MPANLVDEAQERENAPGNKITLRNISRHIHTRHRYPGGPTRVPKNGNAVRGTRVDHMAHPGMQWALGACVPGPPG